jgi:hypothetical protein
MFEADEPIQVEPDSQAANDRPPGSTTRTYLERLHERNIYTCVLVKGINPAGTRCYAYFGVFAGHLRELLRQFELGQPFNPANHPCIVLARGEGEPDPHIQTFMRRKFSHSSTGVILEISQPDERSISTSS